MGAVAVAVAVEFASTVEFAFESAVEFVAAACFLFLGGRLWRCL